jgi:hypothetical protein
VTDGSAGNTAFDVVATAGAGGAVDAFALGRSGDDAEAKAPDDGGGA